MLVRVHHPLQQGLRQETNGVLVKLEPVRVHHPLQQGLRRFFGSSTRFFFISASASSITTRIKTYLDHRHQ